MASQLDYERVALLPVLVKALCFGCNAWVVGSGARYLMGEGSQPPKDWDVMVPFPDWRRACRLIPRGTPANSFGGAKIVTGEATVDLWPQDLGEYLTHCSDPEACAVHPESRRTVRTSVGFVKTGGLPTATRSAPTREPTKEEIACLAGGYASTERT